MNKHPDIKTGRFNVRWRSFGELQNSSLRPIVCVNGTYQTIGAWKSFISFFKPYTQVVVFDMPGVGGSVIENGSVEVSLKEQAEVLSSVIDHATSGNVNIFAASWGGVAASEYASRSTNKINALLLASFGLSANENMKQVIDVINRNINSKNYNDIYKAIINTFGERLSVSMKKDLKKQFESTNAYSMKYLYSHLLYCRSANLIKEIEFSKIEADTYIFSGEHDCIVDIEELSILENIIPRCKRNIILGHGHFLHFENPEILSEYARILLEPVNKLRKV